MKKYVGLLLFLGIIMVTGIAYGQGNGAKQAAYDQAWEGARKAGRVGPAEVTLRDQGKMQIPRGFIYIPQPEAGRLLHAMGEQDFDTLLGLVMEENDDEDWMVIISYWGDGYIKDEDAKNWNVDELFKSLQEGTEEGNQDRKKRGFPELEIIGWIEKPKYDSTKKYLVWSISAKDKGDTSNDAASKSVNYNTYALGREGYLALELVTDLENVENHKPIVHRLLENTKFVQGKRYEDYNPSTDKLAEYSLAALITGAAAQKLGVFALVAGVFAKFGKLIALVAVAVGGAAASLLRRKKKKTASGEE